jgi:hypothetical protein
VLRLQAFTPLEVACLALHSTANDQAQVSHDVHQETDLSCPKLSGVAVDSGQHLALPSLIRQEATCIGLQCCASTMCATP